MNIIITSGLPATKHTQNTKWHILKFNDLAIGLSHNHTHPSPHPLSNHHPLLRNLLTPRTHSLPWNLQWLISILNRTPSFQFIVLIYQPMRYSAAMVFAPGAVFFAYEVGAAALIDLDYGTTHCV